MTKEEIRLQVARDMYKKVKTDAAKRFLEEYGRQKKAEVEEKNI